MLNLADLIFFFWHHCWTWLVQTDKFGSSYWLLKDYMCICRELFNEFKFMRLCMICMYVCMWFFIYGDSLSLFLSRFLFLSLYRFASIFLFYKTTVKSQLVILFNVQPVSSSCSTHETVFCQCVHSFLFIDSSCYSLFSGGSLCTTVFVQKENEKIFLRFFFFGFYYSNIWLYDFQFFLGSFLCIVYLFFITPWMLRIGT